MSRTALTTALTTALCLAALLLLPGRPASGGPGVSYGPVPPGLAAVQTSEKDQALAAIGLRSIESPKGRAADGQVRARR